MGWQGLADLTLANEMVTIRRIKITDRDAFEHIVYDPEIWKFFVTSITCAAELDHFMENAIRDTINGTRIVFAIIDNGSGQIVGSTAYGNLSEADKRLEIGWSWVATAARRTGINRAAKLALLDHAFTALECERVEFKTDVLNEAARKGLTGIGATEEGVLRSFNYMPGGRRRDVIYYSILRGEWPAVRQQRFSGMEK